MAQVPDTATHVLEAWHDEPPGVVEGVAGRVCCVRLRSPTAIDVRLEWHVCPGDTQRRFFYGTYKHLDTYTIYRATRTLLEGTTVRHRGMTQRRHRHAPQGQLHPVRARPRASRCIY